MTDLMREISLAVRGLLRRPALAAVAIVTLALGIGATTAIFSVVNAVVLRPLPFPDPEQLVAILEVNQGEGLTEIPASALDYLAWKERSTQFSEMAAYSSPQVTLSTGEGDPERIPAAVVRAGFFDLFRVRPLLGRSFFDDDDDQGAPKVAVLSHGLWQRSFGGDPGVVGRTVRINGELTEVVGVMPESFRFPSTAQLWVPLVFSDTQLEDRNWHFAQTLARLEPSATLESANEELAAIAAQQAEAYPDSNDGWSAAAVPLHEQFVGDTGATLWALLGAVGFVLLIGCTNIANLLLARALGRRRETAVRTALGAGRGQLLRQLMVESLVLTTVGTAAGLGLAVLGLDAFLSLSSLTVPGGMPVTLDSTVLLFTVAVSVGVTLAFGAAPLLLVESSDPFGELREGARGAAGTAGGQARAMLVAGEIALAVVLVVGASVMVQSLREVLRSDPGFPADDLLVVQLALPDERYDSPDEIRSFWTDLLERVHAAPGVETAGVASWLPPMSGPLVHHRIEGVHTAWTIDLPAVRSRLVSAHYLQTLGVELIRGRLISAEDRPETERVVVVDQAFADQLFPGEDPLGRSIRVWEDEPRRIVGVVGNVKNTGLAGEAEATSYVPMSQTPWLNAGLIVRAPAEPGAIVPALRELVGDLDPTLPLFGVETMEDRLEESVSGADFQTRFIALFSLLALALAAVGIYGMMARSVVERTREFGLRIALGASGASVRRMVIHRGLLVTAGGLGAGIGVALALRRVLSGFLFGIETIDPWILGAVGAVLAGVALLASWLPAWRASRLDPVKALSTQ